MIILYIYKIAKRKVVFPNFISERTLKFQTDEFSHFDVPHLFMYCSLFPMLSILIRILWGPKIIIFKFVFFIGGFFVSSPTFWILVIPCFQLIYIFVDVRDVFLKLGYIIVTGFTLILCFFGRSCEFIWRISNMEKLVRIIQGLS